MDARIKPGHDDLSTRNRRKTDGHTSAGRSASHRAQFALALFRRHGDQPHDRAAAGALAADRLARARCPRRRRAAFISRSPAAALSPPARGGDLACPAQQRDDGGSLAESAGLAARACFHLGGAAPPHLGDALSDRAHGWRDRGERGGGVLSEASRHRHPARHRYRALCAGTRPRRRLCRHRPAGQIRHRLFRARARAKRHRHFRRGDVPAAAEISRLHRAS